MEELDTKYYITVIVGLSIALFLIHLYQKASMKNKTLSIKAFIIFMPIVLLTSLIFANVNLIEIILTTVISCAISIYLWKNYRACFKCKTVSFNQGSFFKPSLYCPHCGEKNHSI